MIRINKYSRPGVKHHGIRAIVIHWPYWVNVDAKTLHDYFDNIEKERRYASCHYCIGALGEIEQCIPEDEIAYHCGSSKPDPASGKIYTDLARRMFDKYATATWSPNYVTLGIEVSHIDMYGTVSEIARASLIKLCHELCGRYSLDANTQIIRHFDIVGWKSCPRYWVDHPDDWVLLKKQIEEYKE